MEKHGGNIYEKEIRLDFSVNVNPFGIPETVMQAACRGFAMSDVYPDPEVRQLREELSCFHRLSADRIVCGNGASELIYAAVMAFRPARALVAGPVFGEYGRALTAAGCRWEEETLLDGRRLSSGERFLERAESEDWDMIVICNPDNPTGQMFPQLFLEKLLAVCRRKSCVLLADECFMEFADPDQRFSLTDSFSGGGRILVIKAFTKIYGMPGIRLGYLLAADAADAGAVAGVLPPWNVSMTAQLAGTAALKEQEFVKESARKLREECRRMRKQLQEAQITVWESDVNFFLLEGPEDLQAECLDEGILIRDCSSFCGLGKGIYRIGVKTKAENEELIKRLKDRMEQGRWQK